MQRELLEVKSALEAEQRHFGLDAVLFSADPLTVFIDSTHTDLTDSADIVHIKGLIQAHDLTGEKPANIDDLAVTQTLGLAEFDSIDAKLLGNELSILFARACAGIIYNSSKHSLASFLIK